MSIVANSVRPLCPLNISNIICVLLLILLWFNLWVNYCLVYLYSVNTITYIFIDNFAISFPNQWSPLYLSMK